MQTQNQREEEQRPGADRQTDKNQDDRQNIGQGKPMQGQERDEDQEQDMEQEDQNASLGTP